MVVVHTLFSPVLDPLLGRPHLPGADFQEPPNHLSRQKEGLREHVPSRGKVIQEPRKGINIKNLGRNPPSQTPPKGPLTLQILYAWGLFSLQNTGKSRHKEFRAGGS